MTRFIANKTPTETGLIEEGLLDTLIQSANSKPLDNVNLVYYLLLLLLFHLLYSFNAHLFLS